MDLPEAENVTMLDHQNPFGSTQLNYLVWFNHQIPWDHIDDYRSCSVPHKSCCFQTCWSQLKWCNWKKSLYLGELSTALALMPMLSSARRDAISGVCGLGLMAPLAPSSWWRLMDGEMELRCMEGERRMWGEEDCEDESTFSTSNDLFSAAKNRTRHEIYFNPLSDDNQLSVCFFCLACLCQ